ncbi:MAG: CAP domain-containing protein [Chloroflexota bacterium]
MLTPRRRVAALLFAAVLAMPVAGPVAATEPDPGAVVPVTPEFLTQAELDLVHMTNDRRTAAGLVALRVDPDLMAIAHARAELMAANDVLSHTEPDGRKVFDHLNEAGITWFAAGEIIVWNNYPLEYTTAAAIEAWVESPPHHEVMFSTGYNYVGFGAAVSATGLRYYAGLFVREPDETGAWAKFGTITKRSVSHSYAQVTIRWAGGDRRLQVLTAGLRYFQVQRRRVGGSWVSWRITTATHRTVTWSKTWDREVRVRARDRAGNWGPWQVIRIAV